MSAPLLFALMRVFKQRRATDLPAHHRLVLLALADAADETGKAWPSALTISETTGQSRSTVQIALAELEEAGWISCDRRGNGFRRFSTVYIVNVDGRPIARSRPGRHAPPPDPASPVDSPRGVPSDGPPGTPCPAHRAPHTVPLGLCSPRGGQSDSPRGGPDPTRSDPTKNQTHTAGARAKGSRAGEEGDAVLDELRRHPEIVAAARGDKDALPVLASKVVNDAMIGKGKLLAWVLVAIQEAATQLAFEPGVLWVAAASKVVSFAKNARPPRPGSVHDPPQERAAFVPRHDCRNQPSPLELKDT